MFVTVVSTLSFRVLVCPLQRMERDFYQNQKELTRLGELKQKLADLPKQRQCHRYRWTQTETTFDMEIPIHKPCDDKDLFLVLDKDQLQVAIKTDEPFGAITVGRIVSAHCFVARPRCHCQTNGSDCRYYRRLSRNMNTISTAAASL